MYKYAHLLHEVSPASKVSQQALRTGRHGCRPRQTKKTDGRTAQQLITGMRSLYLAWCNSLPGAKISTCNRASGAGVSFSRRNQGLISTGALAFATLFFATGSNGAADDAAKANMAQQSCGLRVRFVQEAKAKRCKLALLRSSSYGRPSRPAALRATNLTGAHRQHALLV